jgi:hypothetical protein
VEITIGALLNAIGILLGGLFGLVRDKRFSLPAQVFFRNVIGAFNVFFALRLIYENMDGTFSSCLKQILIALAAVVLGFWTGKLFRLQKFSNYLGRAAGNTITQAAKNPSHHAADGFNACAVLFCAEPLGIIGAVTDGLSNYFYLLAVKAATDALAMLDLVKIFRWPSILSAVPVFVFFSAITMAMQVYIKPLLTPHELASINVTAGVLACIVTVVMFGIRKAELANYLPALAIAPLLAKWIN